MNDYFIMIEEGDGVIQKYDLGPGACFKLNFGNDQILVQVWDDKHSWMVPQERLVAACLPNLGRKSEK